MKLAASLLSQQPIAFLPLHALFFCGVLRLGLVFVFLLPGLPVVFLPALYEIVLLLLALTFYTAQGLVLGSRNEILCDLSRSVSSERL